MSTRSHRWLLDALEAGMHPLTAYIGSEVIQSWEQFWGYQIAEENLLGMKEFGLTQPEAALHRWSIQAGPRPWVPDDQTRERLKADPRWSVLENLKEQGQRIAPHYHRPPPPPDCP